jgi:hypothetical protein
MEHLSNSRVRLVFALAMGAAGLEMVIRGGEALLHHG